MKTAAALLLCAMLYLCWNTNAVDANPCEVVKCTACRECKVNNKGQARCVYTSGCCPDPKTTMVNCFVSPCHPQATKNKCPKAAKCIEDYCTGCNAHYYDKDLNEICTADQSGTRVKRQGNPCSGRPCPKGKKCVPSPKQCFTTPCPQFDCV